MPPFRVYTALPEAQLHQYPPGKEIRTVSKFEGMEMIPGTLNVTATVVPSAVIPVAAGTQCFFPPQAGGMAFFESIQTITQTRGSLESLFQVAGLAYMEGMAVSFKESIACESDKAMAGRCATPQQSLALLLGQTAGTGFTFTFPLPTVLNRASKNIPYSKVGAVTHIFIPRVTSRVLWGAYAAATPALTYYLRDFTLRWSVVPTNQATMNDPINLVYYQTQEFNTTSTITSINSNVTGVCDAVHCRLIKTSHDQDQTYNPLACEAPYGAPILVNGDAVPSKQWGITDIVYRLGGSDTALSEFHFQSPQEILLNGIRSFTEHPAAFQSYLQDPLVDGYVLGIRFGGLVDLAVRPFSVVMQAQFDDDPVGEQYNGYLYYRCHLTI